MDIDLHRHPDIDAIAAAVAQRWAAIAREAVARQGAFRVALAGGNTPRALYRRLAQADYAQLPWSQTHVFFGDERCVTQDHPDSNYRMAREALLQHVPIPPDQVHAMVGQPDDPQGEARRYAERLAAEPALDLVLLGMGADGHFASLFPQTGAIDIIDRPVTAVFVSKLDAWRVSLTLPAITAADHVILMVAGTDKADTLAQALVPTSHGLPVERLIAARPTEWHVDARAAGRLES